MHGLSSEKLYRHFRAEILRAFNSNFEMSNVELARRLGLSYRVVQATTARMERENDITCSIAQRGRFGKTVWRLATRKEIGVPNEKA
jgi:DNA-binding Lrp family transcriptional regulator